MGFSENANVVWLLSHSYGQGGSVATPTVRHSQQPMGRFPAGVENAIDHVFDNYCNWDAVNAKHVDWCFLVGGPGNGKSEAIRTLAGVLDVQLPQKVAGQPAPRSVPREWPGDAAQVVEGLDIVFINDASIPRSDAPLPDKRGSLFLDVRDGLERFQEGGTPVILFGNVNRGILVEELKHIKSNGNLMAEKDAVAADVIRWLAGDGKEEEGTNSRISTICEIDPRHPYYGQFRISLTELGSPIDVVCHVLFLDVLSLLEPSPGGADTAIDFSTSPPTVRRYHTFGGVGTGAAREDTTVGELLGKLVEADRWEEGACKTNDGSLCEAFASCPFAQNVVWLRNPTLQRNALDAFRSAEVAASRRLTYRDVLGHFSLAMLGPTELPWLSGTHPCNWVAKHVSTISDTASLDRKRSITELAGHRIYAALFPPPDERTWKSYRRPSRKQDRLYEAVVAFLERDVAGRSVAFDAAFKTIDPSLSSEPWDDLRYVLMDIVESLEIKTITEQVNELTSIDEPINSQIEVVLDQTLREELASELSETTYLEAARDRARLLRKWRSIMLLRQIGLATGNLSFLPAIRAWLAEQERALHGSQSLALKKGIQNLVMPKNENGEMLIAPFRPRTYSLPADPPENLIFLSVNADDLFIRITTYGDTLLAELSMNASGGQPQKIASLGVDLAVTREAMLHCDGDLSPFTEIGNSAFARIERARAALIGRSRTTMSAVEFTNDMGVRFKLVHNPAGTPPLRVIKS